MSQSVGRITVDYFLSMGRGDAEGTRFDGDGGDGSHAMLDSESSAGFSGAFEGNTPGLVVKFAIVRR